MIVSKRIANNKKFAIRIEIWYILVIIERGNIMMEKKEKIKKVLFYIAILLNPEFGS